MQIFLFPVVRACLCLTSEASSPCAFTLAVTSFMCIRTVHCQMYLLETNKPISFPLFLVSRPSSYEHDGTVTCRSKPVRWWWTVEPSSHRTTSSTSDESRTRRTSEPGLCYWYVTVIKAGLHKFSSISARTS